MMTLSFKTEINGKPNYFVEKIWKWLSDSQDYEFFISSHQYEMAYQELYPCQYTEQENIHYHKPKLHTIRRDEKDRWQPGKIIHPVINNRTPNRLQFANEFPCISTQSFQIIYDDGKPTVYIGDSKEDLMPFYIEDAKEGIVYGHEEMIWLATNDGFESIEAFFDYFNVDFQGKIIHWTDTKY